MLELCNVGFEYASNIPVFSDVSIKIGRGEFIALGGRNGCGKTTVTRLLMGLEQPREGEILYNGNSLKGIEPAQRGRFIGYVFQQPDRQMFRGTVQEEVAYGPLQLGGTKHSVEKTVREALAMTDLTALAEMYPPNLSRGQKQRVAIASALAMHTEYLVLDEPTSGQDGQEKKDLMELLTTLHQRGMTIILVTHDMEVMAKYCERAIIIGYGTKAFDGTPEELFTKREDLTALGLTRPAAVTLSLAVPGLPYCKSMEDFETQLIARLGGEKQ